MVGATNSTSVAGAPTILVEHTSLRRRGTMFVDVDTYPNATPEELEQHQFATVEKV